MTEEKKQGKTADEMNVHELRELAVSLGLITKEEAEKSRTSSLLKKIKEWEIKELEKINENEFAVINEDEDFDGEDMVDVAEESVVEDTFQGKKVLARKEKEINGKFYEEITVATGETFLELK